MFVLILRGASSCDVNGLSSAAVVINLLFLYNSFPVNENKQVNKRQLMKMTCFMRADQAFASYVCSTRHFSGWTCLFLLRKFVVISLVFYDRTGLARNEAFLAS